MKKVIKIDKDITDHMSKNPDFILPKEEKWDLVTRLNRCSGHIESIRPLIYQDEDPKIVMSQLLAIKGEISAVEKHYLSAYSSLAKTKLIKNGDESYLNELKELIEIYLK